MSIIGGIQDNLRNARAALRAHETPGETPGSFQRASEEKLRTRRLVSVADRFRRSAAEKPPSRRVQEAEDETPPTTTEPS